jgi:hypothetical protein
MGLVVPARGQGLQPALENNPSKGSEFAAFILSIGPAVFYIGGWLLPIPPVPFFGFIDILKQHGKGSSRWAV